MEKFAFHQWSVADTEKHFSVGIKEGLSKQEASFRLEKNGLNSIEKLKETSTLVLFLRQFTNFFIILLLISTVLSFVLKDKTEAYILLIIVVLNIAISFFQEYKAEKSLSALKKSLSFKTKVRRDGRVLEIDAKNVVIGDIVILSEGDKIPADLRLFEENGLRNNEATLTGESAPLSKSVNILNIKTPLSERRNLAFAGTTVYAGRGRGIVVATGFETEFGKIAEMVSVKDEETPLEKRILYIGKILSIFVIAMSVIVLILGLVQGWYFLDIFSYVIALLVAAVPESLPTVVTLSLAIGVIEMAKKNAIVRRLAVVEALGSVNIIVTDKTGTLTGNKLEVSELAYFQYGNITRHKKDKRFNAKVCDILFYAALASDSNGDKAGSFVGDPMECSVLDHLYSSSRKLFNSWKDYEEHTTLPFDSKRKYMASEGNTDGKNVIALKGAVEKVLPFCKLSKKETLEIENISQQMSKSGLKTIAVCKKDLGRSNIGKYKNMEFLGIIGFLDEPVPGIKEALLKTVQAGIRPVMVTGDHPATALHIANEVGMKVRPEEIISSEDIKNLTPKALDKLISKIKIFARATPEEKIRIVEAFERAGYTVAVTGDGVNDAPALKAATVGVAMGVRGSDVAREASDIVLADDNYGTIVSAIEYGRTIYDNIKNALVFLLSSNFAELFLIVLAFVLGLPAPLIAIQILWVNLITDSLPAIALAFEKPSASVLKEQPRSGKEESINPSLKYASMLGVMMLVVAIAMYLWGLHDSIAKARTMVFFSIILTEMVLVFSVRSKVRIWQNVAEFFSNKYLNIAVLISIMLQFVTLLPHTRDFFSVVSLPADEVYAIIISVIVVFFAAEIIRFNFDRKNNSKRYKKSPTFWQGY